ncbi:MAG: 4Fe-4S dicluster domain-containing protein [Deltaproteobacteria bacterium]|nr:4Fe-4S dicluster domain-containing protein [Deltaproteobacteria bacterium]
MAHRIGEECNGCSACKRQCPTSAIQGEPPLSALVRRGDSSPAEAPFEIEARACIDCGVCGMVCPVGAVCDARGVTVPCLPRDARPRPKVTSDLCNGCGLCMDFCAFDCIALVGSRYSGVAYLARPMACVSCGDCATVCIKGAVAMGPADLRELDPEADRGRLSRYLR